MKTLKHEEILAYEYETMNDVIGRLPRFIEPFNLPRTDEETAFSFAFEPLFRNKIIFSTTFPLTRAVYCGQFDNRFCTIPGAEVRSDGQGI